MGVDTPPRNRPLGEQTPPGADTPPPPHEQTPSTPEADPLGADTPQEQTHSLEAGADPGFGQGGGSRF